MAKRELQFVDGKSHKFWAIELKGKTQAVTFGRIGTSGQTQSKDFDTPQEAKKSYDKLVQQKLKKGYVDAKKSTSVKTDANKKTARKPTARRKVTKKTFAKKSNSFWKPLAQRDRDRRHTVTPKLVDAREKSLGIRFPTALLKLLRKQNGGYLLDPEFIVGADTYYVEGIPPILEDGGIESLAVEYPDHLELAAGKLPKAELIFPLCGDGHWFIALDYRNVGPAAEPEVIYLNIEGKMSCRKIADSFDKFLAGQQTGDERLAVRIDEIDPDTLIAKADIETTHRRGKETKISYRARLCLTETQAVLYTYESWKKPRRELEETWERALVNLKELDTDRLRVDKKDPCCHFAKPRATLTVYADRSVGGVHGMTSERKRTNRWKNLPFGPVNYFKIVSDDVVLLEKCRRRILKDCRKAQV